MACDDDSLQLEADTGDVLLGPGARLEWIVGGHQVGAQWKDKELEIMHHLGGPSPIHGNDGSLRLWFALDQDENELLVVLTMSVKSRSKSKARPRSFFLVVPAEDLCMTSAMHDFHPMSPELVPEALFERPADTVSANATRILHVSFALGHKRTCGVVMNSRPYSGKMRGTPLALLDGLKSLSEAREFDLYLKFSSYAQVGLQRLSRVMDRNVAFFTPKFDLRGMYGSGWDGAFDVWEAQGWHHAQSVLSRKRKACSPLLSEEQTEALPVYNHPPAYTNSSSLPRIPHTRPAKQPGPELCHATSPSSIVCENIAPGISATPYSPYPVVFSGPASQKSPNPITYSPLPTLYPAGNASTLTQIYDSEMGIWLLTAWNLVPNIHFLLIRELLTVSAAANNKDELGYRAARVVCAKKLAGVVADRMQQTEFTSNVDDKTQREESRNKILVSEPDSCISWLFMLRPGGDVGFMELLGKLEVRKRIALCASGHDFDDAFRNAMVIRAAIVLQALSIEGTQG
ncbi:hypothetical protein M436DRAFT_83741 [Aureobasidium namibiae CBS 147.97]|uniref:Uncharacterized protein n=1 Tax=Aureobasidium namibiae CBS 147.97 TaxID=1043004 RepID=A0A074WEE3_9PEZI